MEAVILQIAGMHCNGCAATIKAVVEREPGVKAAAVAFESGVARILYDPKATSADQFVAAVGHLGYRVTGRAR